MQQLIHHVAGNDTLWGVDKVNVFTNLEAARLNYGTNIFIDSPRADCAFYHHSGSLGTDLHHFLDGSHHITGIDFFAELVVRRWYRDDICVGYLVLRGKFDTSFQSGLKEFVEAVFLKGGLTSIKRRHQFLIVVRTDNFNTM